jgi:hypothetical protein
VPTDRCPRCGRTFDVEELGASAGSIWMHCRKCGHLWREPSPGLDAFAVILASRAAEAVPMEEAPRPDAQPRAARFQIRLPIRYRLAGDADWRSGVTENISRSGILFRSDAVLPLNTPLDLVLLLPGRVAGQPTSRVRCQGAIVRTVSPPTPDEEPGAAARVAGYELATS